MATPSADRVRFAVQSLQSRTQNLLQEFDGTILYAKLVAEDLEKQHDSASVQELQDATLDILTCCNDLRNYSKALDTVGASYQTSTEVTDFKKLLKGHVKELDEESPFDPEKQEFLKQFKEAVWKVHHAGEPMPGQEQEEIVVMAGSQTLPNTSCPLSGKPVDQLANPVRSQQCKHIYERAAVLTYIRNHLAEFQFGRGRRDRAIPPANVPLLVSLFDFFANFLEKLFLQTRVHMFMLSLLQHPLPEGCPGNLVEDQLICDGSLKIEIQEYMLRQRSSNVDTVADCTYLEEDDDTPLKPDPSRQF